MVAFNKFTDALLDVAGFELLHIGKIDRQISGTVLPVQSKKVGNLGGDARQMQLPITCSPRPQEH